MLSTDRITMPQVGIYYLTWFANDFPAGGENTPPWDDSIKPIFGVGNVKPLSTGDPSGWCYSSSNDQTAVVHAALLADLGIDFVVFDDTNLSPFMKPSDNKMFRDSIRAMNGFRSCTGKRIRSTFMLSLGAWGDRFGETGEFAQTDFFHFKEEHTGAHIDAIAAMHEAHPDDFVKIDGKPLLLFYVSAGNSMYVYPPGPDGTLTNKFHGYGSIVPTPWDFDYLVKVRGTAVPIRDYFSVRWAAVCVEQHDYTQHPESGSGEIWPFTCHYGWGYNYSEVGFAGVFSPGYYPNRRAELFDRCIGEARDKQFIFIRSWNEFSGTDEPVPQVWTLEPNNCVHLHDTTPGNQDPWWFFARVQARLAQLRTSAS